MSIESDLKRDGIEVTSIIKSTKKQEKWFIIQDLYPIGNISKPI